MEPLKLKKMYLKEALLKGYTCSNYVLLKLQAPSNPAREKVRPSMNLAIVLDHSGSMSGRPLEEAKRCAIDIINHLTHMDRVSVVFYSSTAKVLVPSTTVNNKAMIIEAIKGVRAGGNTNLHAGWAEGAAELLKHSSDYSINRVLLLSDGMANAGIVDIPSLKKEAHEMALKGVSTSTYGLSQNFNETLMLEMASSGQGNAYYGETAEELHEPFMDEFAMLSDLFIQSMQLQIFPERGVTIEPINTLSYDESTNSYALANLPYDAELDVLFKITVEKSVTTCETPIKLFAVHIHYQTILSDISRELKDTAEIMAIPPSAMSMLVENPVVAQKKRELQFSRLQQSLIIALESRNREEAKRLLEAAKVVADNDPLLVGLVQELSQLLDRREERWARKQVAYSSRQLESTASSLLVDSPDYLKRKRQMGKRR